jgi:hypothetical protein
MGCLSSVIGHWSLVIGGELFMAFPTFGLNPLLPLGTRGEG